MDAVLAERGRAEIASRMWIAEITGEPCVVDGLDEALRLSGMAYPDGDNVERVLLGIIRIEEERGTDWESHSVVGLLADGRWGWVLTASEKLKRGKKRGPASPRNLLLFGPTRRAFERALADGLAKHGLTASIPIDEMLRAEVDKFIGGGSLHGNVFRWLAEDPILREPELQAALHARRDDQYMKRDMARLLDGPAAPK
jgi:hypothetical protein